MNQRGAIILGTAVLVLVMGRGAWPAAQPLWTNSQLPTNAKETIQLPAPTGALSIGTKVCDWVDRSRHEQASKNPADFRQLIVQVWYPTEDRSGPASPYVPKLSSYRHLWEDHPVCSDAL